MKSEGVHPREFIIPWCETFDLPISIARRLWVEGFQDGDTLETMSLGDLAEFDISGEHGAAIMKAVNSYKKNRENVDSCIMLINSSSTDEHGVVYKKDKRSGMFSISQIYFDNIYFFNNLWLFP